MIFLAFAVFSSVRLVCNRLRNITLTLKMSLEIWVKISRTDVVYHWVTFVSPTFFHDTSRLVGRLSEKEIKTHVLPKKIEYF